MSNSEENKSSVEGGSMGRRKFLAGAAVVGGSASLLANNATLESEGEERVSNTDTLESKGYQETDHVRAYYKTASV